MDTFPDCPRLQISLCIEMNSMLFLLEFPWQTHFENPE